MITSANLWNDFEYCLNDGYLYRRSGRYKGCKAGTIKKPHGYISVWYKGCKHYAHRLIWLWFTGKFPKNVIDHINRNPSDNRIQNLRDVTQTYNQLNRGDVGVSLMPNGKYRAYISIDKVFYHIGLFKTKEDALNARRLYEIKNLCPQKLQEQS